MTLFSKIIRYYFFLIELKWLSILCWLFHVPAFDWNSALFLSESLEFLGFLSKFCQFMVSCRYHFQKRVSTITHFNGITHSNKFFFSSGVFYKVQKTNLQIVIHWILMSIDMHWRLKLPLSELLVNLIGFGYNPTRNSLTQNTQHKCTCTWYLYNGDTLHFKRLIALKYK